MNIKKKMQGCFFTGKWKEKGKSHSNKGHRGTCLRAFSVLFYNEAVT